MRWCELSRSLRVSVFTIENVLRLTHSQNTSFMFALPQFGLRRIQQRFCTVSSIVPAPPPPIQGRLKKIRDSFSCGYSIKGNKRLIWLMMNYSVLLNTVIQSQLLLQQWTIPKVSSVNKPRPFQTETRLLKAVFFFFLSFFCCKSK